MRYIVQYLLQDGNRFSVGWKEFTNYWEATGFYDGMQEGGYSVRWEESST